METMISEHEGAVRVETLRAGQKVSSFDFDLTPEQFGDAIRETLASDASSRHFDLPGKIVEVSVVADGVRVSIYHAKRAQRLTTKLKWRDVCTYLVS